MARFKIGARRSKPLANYLPSPTIIRFSLCCSTAFYRSQKITLPKRSYRSVSRKEMEILNLETSPKIHFYRLVMIEPIHIDNGLPVRFFFPGAKIPLMEWSRWKERGI